MNYRDHYIYARVWGSYSDLYGLKDDGSLEDQSEDILIKNNDEKIVWYEVEAVDPNSGFTNMFTELKSIKDAKNLVDKSIAFLHENYPEDYEDE